MQLRSPILSLKNIISDTHQRGNNLDVVVKNQDTWQMGREPLANGQGNTTYLMVKNRDTWQMGSEPLAGGHNILDGEESGPLANGWLGNA